MTILRTGTGKTLLLSLALAALAVIPAGARAESSESASKTSGRPSPHADSLRKGIQWENHGVAYAVLPEVRAAMSANKDETPAATLARHGVTGGTVVDRKGGFVLYREAAAPKPLAGSGSPTPLLATKADPRPVALNMRTKQLAVVLNSIRVELRNPASADTLAT